MSVNDRADAHLCLTQNHARSDEAWSVIACRKIGTPIDNTSLNIVCSIQTETRDETPEWMSDYCEHSVESLALIKKMAVYLGFKDEDENVVESLLNEYVKDHELYQIIDVEESDVHEVTSEALGSVSPIAHFKPTGTRYDGMYFHSPPAELVHVPYIRNRVHRTRSRSREERERLERAAGIPQPNTVQPSNSTTRNVLSSVLDGVSGLFASRESEPIVRTHKVYEIKRIDKCNYKHASRHTNLNFTAKSTCHYPTNYTDNDYSRVMGRNLDSCIAETFIRLPSEHGHAARLKRVINVTTVRSLENPADVSIGSVNMSFLKRKTTHQIVAPKLKLGTVIYSPPGGGKTTMAFRLSNYGVTIYDTTHITEWKMPRKNGIFDFSDEIIVTNQLMYAMNAPNALYVLPCKEVYLKRAQAKNVVLPDYHRTKNYITELCQRPGHKLLLTDFHLADLPWNIHYRVPSSFNLQRINSGLENCESEWYDDVFESNM